MYKTTKRTSRLKGLWFEHKKIVFCKTLMLYFIKNSPMENYIINRLNLNFPWYRIINVYEHSEGKSSTFESLFSFWIIILCIYLSKYMLEKGHELCEKFKWKVKLNWSLANNFLCFLEWILKYFFFSFINYSCFVIQNNVKLSWDILITDD